MTTSAPSRVAGEARRLSLQGILYNPLTRRFLVEAGIQEGMRILDVGCGVGDVSRTAADLVGPSGSVVGIDCSTAILAHARQRAGATIQFLQADAEHTPFGREFDAVVGRFVIRGFIDARATVRHLAGRVRDGGVVALQEKLLDVPVRSYPRNQIVDEAWQRMDRVRRLARVEMAPGARLGSIFEGAGLQVPNLRVETPAGGGAGWEGYDYLAETLRGMLPLEQRCGIVPEAPNIDDLPERMASAAAPQGITTLVPCVGAWALTVG